MRTWYAAIRCWLFYRSTGHEFHRHRFVRGKMRLICEACGHETEGIEVTAPRRWRGPRLIRRGRWWNTNKTA